MAKLRRNLRARRWRDYWDAIDRAAAKAPRLKGREQTMPDDRKLDGEQGLETVTLEERVIDDPEWAAREIVWLRAERDALQREMHDLQAACIAKDNQIGNLTPTASLVRPALGSPATPALQTAAVPDVRPQSGRSVGCGRRAA